MGSPSRLYNPQRPSRSPEKHAPSNSILAAFSPLSLPKLLNKLALVARPPNTPPGSPKKKTAVRTPASKLYNNEDDVFGGIAVVDKENHHNSPLGLSSKFSDLSAIDKAFELLLDSRGIAEHLRQQLRELDTNVKVNLINNDMCPSPTILDSSVKITNKQNTQPETYPWSPKKIKLHNYTRDNPPYLTDPRDYGEYLRFNSVGVSVKVVRQLRLSLQCEKLQWMNKFLECSGIEFISQHLIEISRIQWREETDDEMYRELMHCLKLIGQFEKGTLYISTVAPILFPALIDFLFSEKQPALFTDRAYIIAVLNEYLANCSSHIGRQRAETLLSYIEDPPPKAEDLGPDFLEVCHRRRPFKNWCLECGNVVRDAFWLFTHVSYIIKLQDFDINDIFKPKDSNPDEVTANRQNGSVEKAAVEYIALHIQLLNLILARTPSVTNRNNIRDKLRDSGFEKLVGNYLRASSGVYTNSLHQNLETLVSFAFKDGWDSEYMRTGLKRHKSNRLPVSDKPLPSLPLDKAIDIIKLPELSFGGEIDTKLSSAGDTDRLFNF
ncbi:armadillo-type protein [Lipomyces arxii]|uniref:armadillo-type protein n=1 Tax=Lipomyces arxii TaxID=56418 RepID=UPI0034CD20CC